MRAFLEPPAHWVLVAVFAASVGLRVAMSLAMWPTYFDTGDVWLHVTAADGDLFHNPIGPAGYAIFLRVLRPFSSSVAFPVIVQHGLGLVAMVLSYDTMVRLNVSRWLALLPVVVLGLSLDQVLIEHYIMTDAFFGFLLILGFWLVVRAQASGGSSVWLLASGVAFGAALTVRFSGLAVVVLSAIAAAILTVGPPRRRVVAGAVVVAGAAAALIPYHIALYVSKDRVSPTVSGGWSMYTRVAPFADCSRFVPPPGTAHLCETSDPDDRPGSDFYAWDGGPARAAFNADFTQGNRELRAWASAAIKAQPLDYARTVTRDLARYYLPIPPARSHRDGLPMNNITPGAPDVKFEQGMEQTFEQYYDNTVPTRRPRMLSILGRLQPMLRFGTPLMLASVIASAIGLGFLRGRERIWTLFAASMSIGVIGLSALIVGYVWRYAVPELPFAAMTVALSISGLMKRRNRERGRQPEDATIPA